MSRSATEEVKHKRIVQGALSITGATLGLAALGTKGGAVALRKYPKALKSVTVNPKRLESASLGLMTTGAGVGGMSGYHYAALQRAENKSQKKMERDNKMLERSAFGVVTKANRKDSNTAQNIGYTGAAGGTMAALAAPDIHERQMRDARRKFKKETEQAPTKGFDRVNEKALANARLITEETQAKKDAVRYAMENRHGKDAEPRAGKARAPGYKQATQEGKAAYAANDAAAETGRARALLQPAKNLKAAGKKYPTKKIAGVALAGAGLSLAAGEAARRHNHRSDFKKNDDWWSDSN